MRPDIIDPDGWNGDPRWWVRLAWLAGIWAASVAALALVAGLIRRWLH